MILRGRPEVEGRMARRLRGEAEVG